MKKLIKAVALMMLVVVVMLLFSVVAFATDGTDDAGGINILEYVVQKAYILIPALYVVGLIIKKIPGLPDWIIPIVLLGLGVVAAMAIIGWTIEGVIQGVLVSGVTVFANQAYKQFMIKRKEE